MAQTSKEGDECGGDEGGTHYTIQETVRTKRAVQKEESIRVVRWERKTRRTPPAGGSSLCGAEGSFAGLAANVPEAWVRLLKIGAKYLFQYGFGGDSSLCGNTS